MPSATWNYTAQPASDAYSSAPSNGLAGFFNQPDIGAEFGERLGLIGEILSRTGSGQGLAGISGQMGQMNERSAARKDRRRKLQMVNRFADKIEQSNPEMAAMMRANPDFGMELLGKQMLGKEDRAGQLALAKEMAPFELEQTRQKAIIQGDVSLADQLAELKAEKEMKLADIAANEARIRAIFGFNGQTDTATPVPPPVTETATSEPAPAPAPIPPGIGAGQGTEPAPGPQPAPVTPPVTPPAPAPTPGPPQIDFFTLAPEPPSRNPLVAQIQQSMTSQFGIPAAATDAAKVMEAMTRKDGTLGPIMDAMQQRYDQKKQMLQQQAFQQQQEQARRVWEEGKGQRNMEVFNAGLPEVAPATGAMGPMPQGVAQPGQDPRMVSILQSQGLTPGQVAPGQADITARRIEQGAREGNISTPLGQIADEIAKRQGAQVTELDTRKIEAQRDAVLDPLIADPKVPAPDKDILRLMKLADPQKLSELKQNLSKETQDAYEFSVTQGYEGRRVAVAESAEGRAVAEAEAGKKAAEDKAATLKRGKDIETIAFTHDIQDVVTMANEPGFFSKVGPFTGVTSMLPGGPKQLAQKLENIGSRIGLRALRDARQESPAGGSLVGNPTEKEGERLGQLYGDVQTAQGQDPDKFNIAMKRLYNARLDVVHGVGQGPPRVMVDGTKNFDLVPPEQAIPTYPELAAELKTEQDNAPPKGEEGGEPTMEDIEAEILKRRGK